MKDKIFYKNVKDKGFLSKIINNDDHVLNKNVINQASDLIGVTANKKETIKDATEKLRLLNLHSEKVTQEDIDNIYEKNEILKDFINELDFIMKCLNERVSSLKGQSKEYEKHLNELCFNIAYKSLGSENG